ncbi:MAG: NUDIX domain-containing protein [Thermoleophilaceae bacterium]|nr:NUDIX domain-containing protein [Thermoleophilaceae bacterium]
MQFVFCPVCARELDGDSCPEGHFTFYDNPVPAVQGWVERDGEFLILKRAREPQKGRWDMPGGFVEPGEHPEETVRRELMEETALSVVVERLVGVYPSVYGDTGKKTLDFAYRCRVEGGEFALSDESRGSRWLALADFPELAFAAERAAYADLTRGRS